MSRNVPCLLAILFAACSPETGGPDASDAPDGSNALDASAPDAGPLALAPRIDAVVPTTGEPGTAFRISGADFAVDAVVRFGHALATDALVTDGGRTISGLVPTQADGDPDLVAVSVRNPDGAEAVAADAFTYAAVELVSWCRLLEPLSVDIWSGGTVPTLSARVRHAGVTDGTGRNERLGAQVGYGRATDPVASWTWAWAEWARDEGSDDVYGGSIVPGGLGEWRYAFRFTLGGGRWVYCDGSEEGLSHGFDVDEAGRLTVRAKPRLTSIAPALGRAGDTVTVTGLGLSAAGRFLFGTRPATSATVEPSGNLARLVVPQGTGTVDVGFEYLGATTTLANAFTYRIDPSEVVVTAFTPTALTVEGGTLTITGLNFVEPATVTIGAVEATVTETRSTELTVRVPPLPPGRHAVTVRSQGREENAPAPLSVLARFTPTLDGDVSDWPVELRVAENTITDWVNNELSALYLAYDDDHFYVAVKGRADPNNAIVGYLSTTQLAGGSPNVWTLTDDDGALDDMLSGPWAVQVPGFRAHYGFGTFGAAPDLDDDVADGMGLRAFVCGGCNADFAWGRATVRRSASGVEFAFPWDDGTSMVPANLFVPFPSAGADLSVFVRIVADGGQLFPTASLPADANAQGDPSVRPQVSRVATVEVR